MPRCEIPEIRPFFEEFTGVETDLYTGFSAEAFSDLGRRTIRCYHFPAPIFPAPKKTVHSRFSEKFDMR